MHPDNSPSQYHHKPMGQSGLTRYGSAPGSLLNSAVDSVIGAEREFSTHPSLLGSHYFSGDSSSITSESTCKVSLSNSAAPQEHKSKPLHRSYGLNEIASRIGSASSCSSSSPSSLLRQRSSPADFLSHFVGTDNNGFTVTREMGSYSSQVGTDDPGLSRLKSQMSFSTRHHDSLSHISGESNVDHHGVKSNNSHHDAMLSYNAPTGFGMDSWDNNTNSIVFSPPPGKRAKNMEGDIYNCLNLLESQYSLPQTSLEMERLLQVPEDSIPCKIRAKRGCATHPRSIAERERRTRISGKLKKLQELVPNMDKQTSYSDMLDLAVQHIKGLQNHVKKIEKELEHCTCGCNLTT